MRRYGIDQLLGLTVLKWVNTWVSELLVKMDLLVHVAFSGTLGVHPFGLIDTFVPLHETMSLCIDWLAILAIAGLVRVIKSFIPSIAS